MSENKFNNITEIRDFSAPELDVYARLSEVQLLKYYEPNGGLFIAESPKVITRALDLSYEPISALIDTRDIEGEGLPVVHRLEAEYPDVPIYTASSDILTKLTGFKLTRGMLCAMKRKSLPTAHELCAGAKENIKERCEQIKAQIASTKSDYDKEKLQERLAKLSGGVAVLYVGAASEVEMKEKKDRVDDALRATRAAIEEGIVAGGGVAYIRALEALEGLKGDNADETTGIDIIKRAIEEPLRQIVANAGKEGAVVVQKVREGKADFGYNARTDVYENLHAAGVVDPAKVTRVALENAASIAGMFLTTECVIVEKKEDKPEMPMGAPGMGGMGGMM